MLNNDQELLGRFELGMHRFATRTSEAIEGMDRATGEKGLVWILRNPLADAATEEVFKARLEKINETVFPRPGLKAFGVNNGNGYLITEYVGGAKLPLIEEPMERRAGLFIDAVRIIADCHKAGIVVGDLCEDSLLLRPRGDLCLIALLGPFDKGKPRQNPPSQVFHYLSPEQRSGMAPTLQSDVFALGILGYRLFGGQYPAQKAHAQELNPGEDPLKESVPLSVMRPDSPAWADSIIGTCLALRYTDRFADAGAALKQLEAAARNESYVTGGRWYELVLRNNTTGVMTSPGMKQHANTAADQGEEIDDEELPEAESKGPKYLFLGVLGAIFGILVAGGISFLRSGPSPQTKRPLVEYAELLPPELQQAANIVLDTDAKESSRLQALDQIAANDNPATYSVLASIARIDATRDIRGAVVSALSRRLKDLGHARSGEMIQSWGQETLSRGIDPGPSPVFGALLRACDLTLPLQTRRDSLHKASVDDPGSTLRLAASLSLDDSDEDHFVPVLRQLLIVAGAKGDLSRLGLSALLTLNPFLVAVYERDIIGLLPRTKISDLDGMLESLAQLDHPLLYDVTTEALRRKNLPPFQSVPLRALLDADKLATTKSVKVALVHIARGELTESDVAAVGRWTSLEFESVLLSVLAQTKDRELGLEALETLAGRSASSEPAHELLKWFQSPTLWKHRGDLIKPLGIFGLYKLASEAEIAAAFDQLMPYSTSGTMFRIFIDLGDPKLLRLALDRVAPITGSDILLGLLRHTDKGVRIAAVNSLQGRNEVRVLQDLVRGYEVERDPEVRAAYEAAHWVVKNRGDQALRR